MKSLAAVVIFILLSIHSAMALQGRIPEEMRQIRKMANLGFCDSIPLLIDELKNSGDSDTNSLNSLLHIAYADLYRCTGDDDSLVVSGLKAGNYKGSDDEIKIQVNRVKYLAYEKIQDIDKAMTELHEMYYSAINISDSAVILYALTNLASLAGDRELYEDALKYRKEVLIIADALGQENYQFYAYSGMGNLHFTHYQNLDSAIHYYMTALQFADTTRVVQMVPMYLNLAAAYSEKGQYRTAEMYLSKASHHTDEMDPRERAGYYNSLGYVQFLQNKFREAIIAYEKSNAIVKAETQDLKMEITNTGFISDAYAELKDFENAYKYHFRLEQLKDSMRILQTDELLVEKDKQFQTSVAEQKNKLLQAENNLNEANLQKQRTLITGVVISLALAIAFIIMLFINYRNKQKNLVILDRLNRQLTEQRDEILIINNLLQLKVLRSQMNPHFIYNCLNSILSLVKKNENENAVHYLLVFSKMLRQVLEFTDRQFIILEEEMQFLEHYLSLEKLRLGNEFKYEILLDEIEDSDEIMVPSLVIQPFAENAVWHGLSTKEGERNLQIIFGLQGENHIKCKVRDNGVGRNNSVEKSERLTTHVSRGLAITSERLELLSHKGGKDFKIEYIDDQNGGTEVNIILPCNNPVLKV